MLPGFQSGKLGSDRRKFYFRRLIKWGIILACEETICFLPLSVFQNDWGPMKAGLCKLRLKTSILLTLDAHNEARPLVETRKCLLNIGKLDLRFHGGAR